MAAFRELTTKERVTRTKMYRGVSVDLTLLGPTAILDCMLTDTVLTEQDINRFVVLEMPRNASVREAICQLNAERFDDRGANRRRITNLIADGHRALL